MAATDPVNFTEEQVEALGGVISGNIGKAKILTTSDYDWPTANPTGIAMWLLEPGIYKTSSQLDFYASGSVGSPIQATLLVVAPSGQSARVVMYAEASSLSAVTSTLWQTLYSSQSSYSAWGKILTENNIATTTGNSSSAVMSQNAVTNMVYARNNPASGVLNDVRIGKSASVANNNPSGSVAIGDYAEARGRQSVALGGSNGTNGSADARSNYSIAIGHDSSSAGANAVALGAGAWTGDKSSVSPAYSVALGANSTTSVQGEASFGGTKLGTNGYNNSQYRLLTNVYDPQSAHDAATKGYVDNNIPATFTTNEWNALWA